MSPGSEECLDELANQIPAFVQRSLTREEAREWACVVLSTLAECKGDPAQIEKRLVSAILENSLPSTT
jgi:hypothetical protein